MERAGRNAAFFDLDKTIIAKSSTLAFSRPLYRGGLINRRAVLRSAYAQFVYLLGGADHDQMERMREYLSRLATGWDVQQVKRDRRRDACTDSSSRSSTTRPRPHRGAPRRRTRRRDRLASGPRSSSRSARCSAPTTHRDADGDRGRRYTGEIEFYAYAENKARRSASWPTSGLRPRSSLRLQRLVTDLPMLEAVGHPHAVNPDRRCARRPSRGVAGPRLHQTHSSPGPGARTHPGLATDPAPGGGRGRGRSRPGRGRPGLGQPPNAPDDGLSASTS